jgi:hypothetical protein
LYTVENTNRDFEITGWYITWACSGDISGLPQIGILIFIPSTEASPTLKREFLG